MMDNILVHSYSFPRIMVSSFLLLIGKWYSSRIYFHLKPTFDSPYLGLYLKCANFSMLAAIFILYFCSFLFEYCLKPICFAAMTNQQLIDNGNRMMDDTDQVIERSKKVSLRINMLALQCFMVLWKISPHSYGSHMSHVIILVLCLNMICSGF